MLGNSPTELERLVTRIHRLIEPEEATIIWNEKIEDPDTGEPRQIDGLIKRDGKLTHIECRHHARIQDVNWIEQLMGRRMSLRADAVIAVSTSGFTRPARIKAQEFGIILREISEMTDAEIAAWGRAVHLKHDYLDVRQMTLVLALHASQVSYVSKTPVLELAGSSVSPIAVILRFVMQHGNLPLYVDRNTNLDTTFKLPGLTADGKIVQQIDLQLKARLKTEVVGLVGVWNYNGVEPIAEAVVSKHGQGELEVIQQGDRASMIIDFSSARVPANCVPVTTLTDFGRVMNVHITPIGHQRLPDVEIDVRYEVRPIAA